ncbi:methyl-accepting chemotaxis protein [Paraburkholderia phenoliruptrix]|uniref:Methyl-accepting chemotaxis protein I, serine sensor receptor n=2 Tax=Paraburkholderia phenoliruptrix TaxID=252970 RepID=K0DZY0_9BURK|nr:methyl-accepting chemotaxis protein [Paraburkholderia phenoliruptrix]AFT90505.1 methyl-accepting chemotaxis protein I, serine sensor receptor [Paraburkholderia phenoliruptrix BR3459a]CAB4053016.1 Methyl-accepting chemotaxis protein I [Paraburkholderia phenoliruptrix]
MFFSRRSINGRLAFVMAFLGVLLAIIGTFGLAGMALSNDANHRTYAEQMPKSIAVGEMTIMVGRQRTSLDRAAINPGSQDAVNMYAEEREDRAAAAKAWRSYLSLPRDAGEDRLAARVTREYEATERELIRFREATILGNLDDIVTLLYSVGKIYAQMQDAANALKTYQYEQSKRQYEASERHYQALRVGSIAAIVVGSFAAFGGWFFLRKAILVPVNECVTHFERIARGDLSRNIDVKTRDEMGRMLEGLAGMQDSLTRTVLLLREGSSAIATATREIADGNADLQARTESYAASLQETAASTEELTSTVQQNSENAQRASGLSSSALDIARRGHEVVAKAVSTMSEITQSSEAITEITSMIEGIAFQTNILALNAAVEAARAGEQGRGFAVVAGEVRALALRSSAAAKEIKDLILHSTSRIDAGSKLVCDAGDSMSELIEAVSRVHTIMSEISAASAEQSSGLIQVSIAVSAMDKGTQLNTALVERAAAAARALQDRAQALAETAAAFRLSE